MQAFDLVRNADPRVVLRNVSRHAGVVRDAAVVRNAKVLKSLLGPALRGFLFQKGKGTKGASIPAHYQAYFTFDYQADNQKLKKLYSQAKADQWDGDTGLPWSTNVDIFDPRVKIINPDILPLQAVPSFGRLPEKQAKAQIAHMAAWVLSQFLHGEQGALYAACQVTEAIHWMDGKLYGSTQVVDEGRHVEVFQRYLTEKLEKQYEINDNLYVLIDALMTDRRWDMKFLGMQIMIEGLALAAFGTLRQNTEEPLLRELLGKVITDEARHVHFGVVALEDYYKKHLTQAEVREREDWAFEVTLLMRNRFLAHEFYDEYYAHAMSRRQWDALVLDSVYMQQFRKTMFRRMIPNLKRIGLLTDRIRPHYAALGLLEWEHERAAPEICAADLIRDSDTPVAVH